MPGGSSEMVDQQDLNRLLLEHEIPGVSVAVLADGQIHCAVAGLANVETRSPVTEETIFPIGSITKLFTTTLIMQLVDAGRVALDDPVTTSLPDLRLSDRKAADEITIRDLLTHMSGISGDYLYDPGSGSDAIERYVQSLATLPMLHRPRELFSYSNAAFILAGYMIERLTGRSWHDVMRARLLQPLDLGLMVTLPKQAGNRSMAVPHRRSHEPGAGLTPGAMWLEFHAGAPAGFTPYATPSDIIEFARLHLNGGRSASGESLLSKSSVALMMEPQVTAIPSGAFDASGWGLGWALHQYGNGPVIGHNGGTSAMLRVLPEKGFAVAVLTNASGGIRLGHELVSKMVRQRFGISLPRQPVIQFVGERMSLQACAGEYRHLDYSATIRAVDDRLLLTMGSGGREGEEVALEPVGANTYVGEFRERGMAKVSFLEPDISGSPAYLHMGLRAYKRLT
jgi:CubicO group peptidase (beta-lactamase class C family)